MKRETHPKNKPSQCDTHNTKTVLRLYVYDVYAQRNHSLSLCNKLNKILRRRPQSTHRKEIPGGGRPFIAIAMPLDPVFRFAMVVFFFEDWITHDYYFYAANLRGVLMS